MSREVVWSPDELVEVKRAATEYQQHDMAEVIGSMKRVRIYVLFHDDVFRDVFASFSEAMLHKHTGGCCVIKTFDRDDY